jgi:carboxyl-terminal processing protease
MKRRWLIVTLLALGLTTVVVNAQLSRDFASEFVNSPSGSALLRTYQALKSNYLTDVDDAVILQGAINGMIEALDDPFTNYLEPKAAAREVQDRSGTFEGIGAVLTPRNRVSGEGVEILTVYAGGPAATAGVQRGDIFLEVDGVDVSEATTSEVVDLVRGPGGTTVAITFLRPGEEDPVRFAIVRDTIQIIDVSSTMLTDGVGYLNLRSFGNQLLYDQMITQLDELEDQGMTALILDLRDNPGGLLSQGVQVADEFLAGGDIVFQRARGVTQRYAAATLAARDLPMVVLVNENSASASEIVAGALQENDRALVIGEPTFGKGVAQSVISLPDGGQLAYTSFEWLTPERRTIAEVGITPDVFAEDTRFPDTITIEGDGAGVGSEINLVVDGEVVGTVIAEQDGSFELVTVGPRPVISEIQGQAVIDLGADSALQVAFDTLLEQVAASN